MDMQRVLEKSRLARESAVKAREKAERLRKEALLIARVPRDAVLPISPLTLVCPYCGAKKGEDCATPKGGFAVLHTLRIKAAALLDAKARRAAAERGRGLAR